MRIVSLFTITVQTSLLILMVLLIRKLLGKQLHPWVLKCLWAVIALRILVPIQFHVEFGWLNQLSGWAQEVKQMLGFSLTNVAIAIWLVGAVALILILFVRNVQFGEMLKKNRQIYGKKDGVRVYFIDGKIGSCLEGLLVPKIYISRLAEDSFDWCKWIVSHEICHYHAWDNWYGFLRCLCLIIQWFNPLVWYAAKCSVEDCELVCDYKVLQDKSKEEQIVYGKCLVAMAAKKPASFLQNLATGNSLSDGSLKRRIGQIGKQTFCPKVIEGLLIVAIIAMTAGCFVGPYNKDYTVMNLANHIPFLRDKMICYQLEEPTQENMNTVIRTIEKRKNAGYLDSFYIVQMDRESIALIFPYADAELRDYYDEKAEKYITNMIVTLKTSSQEYEFEVTEDIVKWEEEEEGYSLWVALSDIGIHSDSIGKYEVSYLGIKKYEGTSNDIANGYIRLVQENSFDDMYDTNELLLLKNPCELIKK